MQNIFFIDGTRLTSLLHSCWHCSLVALSFAFPPETNINVDITK